MTTDVNSILLNLKKIPDTVDELFIYNKKSHYRTIMYVVTYVRHQSSDLK